MFNCIPREIRNTKETSTEKKERKKEAIPNGNIRPANHIEGLYSRKIGCHRVNRKLTFSDTATTKLKENKFKAVFQHDHSPTTETTNRIKNSLVAQLMRNTNEAIMTF